MEGKLNTFSRLSILSENFRNYEILLIRINTETQTKKNHVRQLFITTEISKKKFSLYLRSMVLVFFGNLFYFVKPQLESFIINCYDIPPMIGFSAF